MRKNLAAFIFVLSFTFCIFSQTTPDTEDEVVKISTNIIQIDVTVTDKKGNPIKDLKPGDCVSETDFYNYQKNIFTTGTLGALDYIIRGMRELPGRKSVMLFSDGFKLFSQKERDAVEIARILTSLKRLTDLANRASVVIYTADGRGRIQFGR